MISDKIETRRHFLCHNEIEAVLRGSENLLDTLRDSHRNHQRPQVPSPCTIVWRFSSLEIVAFRERFADADAEMANGNGGEDSKDGLQVRRGL